MMLESKRSRSWRWWVVISAAAVAGVITFFFVGGFHVKLAVRRYVRLLAGDDESKAAVAGDRLDSLFTDVYRFDGDHERANPHAKLGPWATPLLVEALAKRDKEMWRRLVRFLGQTRDPRAFAPLITVAEDEAAAHETRSMALMMIGATGHPAAFAYLSEWLERIAAMPETIEEIKIGETVLREQDIRETYRFRVLLGAMFTMDQGGVALFASHLADEQSDIRRLATMALGELSIPYPRDSIPHLIQAVGDADSEVRFQANLWLWRLTGRRASTGSLAGSSEALDAWKQWLQTEGGAFEVNTKEVARRSALYDKFYNKHMSDFLKAAGEPEGSTEEGTEFPVNALRDAGGIAD